MGVTLIEWTGTRLPSGLMHTGFTFNTHWGCTEQGTPGHSECDNCYARMLALRWGFDIWGYGADRRMFGEKHWNELLKYNKEAETLGARLKVFCNSMSDIFEPRKDLDAVRARFFEMIDKTPWLNYLVLTKHANRIEKYKPSRFQKNVWYGTTVGVNDSKWRIDKLRKIDATVRFLSVEPLLERLADLNLEGIHWVIIGGESGNKARPCKIEWIEDVLKQCRAANVPVFIKQMGSVLAKEMGLQGKGGDWENWPPSLMVREFPE